MIVAVVFLHESMHNLGIQAIPSVFPELWLCNRNVHHIVISATVTLTEVDIPGPIPTCQLTLQQPPPRLQANPYPHRWSVTSDLR